MNNTNNPTKEVDNYYDKYDTDSKKLHKGINKLVVNSSWKQFFFAVLTYQKNKITSAYKFIKHE